LSAADDSAITHTRDAIEGRAALDPTVLAEFEAMIRQHAARIYAVCLRIVRDPELARDVQQDALLTAYRKLPEFEGRSSLSTWMCGIARHTAMNRVRKREELLAEDGLVDPVSPDAGVLKALSRAEREQLVRDAAAACLDAAEQDAVHLRYAESLPYDAIAGCLGLGGANDVRVLLQRSSRRLKSELSRRLGDLGHSMSFVRTRDE
jgi:RNA polymerase sigma-70 factor, ECF subfamily